LEGSKEQFNLFEKVSNLGTKFPKYSPARKNSYLSDKKKVPHVQLFTCLAPTLMDASGKLSNTFTPASILFINLIVFLPTYFHPAPLFANLGRANNGIHYSTVLHIIFLECGLCEQKMKDNSFFSQKYYRKLLKGKLLLLCIRIL